jgi:hypothetical protein
MPNFRGFFFPTLDVANPASNPAANSGSDPLAPLPVLEDEALFQVFVLGTRGAGKTVFLASLFNLLSVQDVAENNFILSCRDTRNLNQLRKYFSQISNPEEDWPAGTFASQEYVFDCEHMKDGQLIKLFKFRYFDFPGGFVTENKSETETNFILGQVKNAHSVLVLLDGQKVLNLLNKQSPPSGETTLFDDLSMMVGLLQQCVGKPLHFAITKSDILKMHTLDAIRNALLRHKGFKNLIQQQCKKYPVHLIPVSAVGENFAEYDPSSQKMIKRPDGLVEPQLVDLSLTLTIVDYLTVISNTISKEFPADAEGITVRNWVLKKLVSGAPLLGSSAGPVVDVGGQMLFHVAAIHPVFQILISVAATMGLRKAMHAGGSRIKEVIEEYKADVDNSFNKITDRRSAIDAIIKSQLLRALKFREQFPESYFETHKSLG